MHASKVVRAAKHTPLIHFLGRRTIPKNIDHTPSVHPASGMKELPKSFFGSTAAKPSSAAAPASSPDALTSLLDLPKRFKTPRISEAELEQVNSGAAEIIF